MILMKSKPGQVDLLQEQDRAQEFRGLDQGLQKEDMQDHLEYGLCPAGT